MPKASKQQIRVTFRENVFRRDGYVCQVCGRQWRPEDADPLLGRMNAHHITDRNEMPNGGYVQENGITVCDGPSSCHMQVEQWHITHGNLVAEGLRPDDLYHKIGSSYEEALEASRRLT